MVNADSRVFRYLEKYVGTYRVKAPYDEFTENFPCTNKGTLDPSFDDLYIPCAKGVIKHTYRPGMLVLYVEGVGKGRNVKRDIDSKYGSKVVYEYEETSDEVLITFHEDYLKKIATIVKPRTSGASIPPYSPKNLPKPPYEIPKEDLDRLDILTKGLDKQVKMLFLRKCVSDFDAVIKKEKGKKFDLKAERKASRLKPRTFIHSIGMWDEYLKFVEKNLKKQAKKK